MSSPHMRRSRYVLLFDGKSLERWQHRCLERLEQWADLTGVIVGSEPSSIDQRLADVPILSLLDLGAGAGVCDFVLRLGRVSIPAELASAAPHGVWYFEHEDEGGLPPFFREMCDAEDVTRAALLRLDAREGEDAILQEGFFPTNKLSYAAGRQRVEDAIADWPARVCRRLGEPDGHPGAIQGAAVNASKSQARRSRFLPLRAAIARRRLALAWERLFRHPQWNVGVLDAPVGTLLAPGTFPDDQIRWLPLASRRSFFADPFAVVRGDTLHVLCEEYDYRDSKGRICSFELPRGRSPSAPAAALVLPFHASYPFLIEQEGRIYCVPESSTANEIALFEADEFPRRWSKITVLVPDFPGVDPTVFRHAGRWWLLCTRGGPLEDVELWAWHASDLLGPWTEHARNPVKTDVRGSRPGGRPFVHDGALYRPTQDCARRYGWRIAIQRVVQLTPTEFREELVTVLEASPESPFPRGRHTLTAVDGLTLIDGRRDVFVWAAFRAFLGIWTSDLRSKVPRLRRT
jgi:hypothetical protein